MTPELAPPLVKLIRGSSKEVSDGRRYARSMAWWSHAGGGGDMRPSGGGGDTVAARMVCAMAVKASVEVMLRSRAACKSEAALISLPIPMLVAARRSDDATAGGRLLRCSVCVRMLAGSSAKSSGSSNVPSPFVSNRRSNNESTAVVSRLNKKVRSSPGSTRPS